MNIKDNALYFHFYQAGGVLVSIQNSHRKRAVVNSFHFVLFTRV